MFTVQPDIGCLQSLLIDEHDVAGGAFFVVLFRVEIKAHSVEGMPASNENFQRIIFNIIPAQSSFAKLALD